ncbi:BUD22-domain-containing protein [Tuber indicum]|nr:BUD22-domain-containing protein [Tuber indicum]
MPKRKNQFTNPPAKSPRLTHPSTTTTLPARAHAQVSKSLTSALPTYHRRIFRVLKKARGFETVKLIRRIKSSRAPAAGAAAQATGPTTRLEGELEALKKVNLDLLARAHLRRCVGRDGRCVRSGVFDWGVWSVGEGEDGEGRGMGKVEHDVCARLYGARVVREVMGDVLGGVRRILGVDEREDMARSGGDGEEEGKRKIEERLGRNKKEEEERLGRNKEEDAEEEEEEEEEEAKSASMSTSASNSDGNDSESEEGEDRQDVWGAESPVSSSDWSASSPPKPKPMPKQKPGVSTFLPTLIAGYISDSSASTSSTTPPKRNKRPPEKKQRKNRMGQQARRALWAKKYGQNAAHLKEGTLRREDFLVGVCWRSSVRKKEGQTEGKLHPSWEAARKAREGKMAVVQEALKGGGGRKVVFD